MRRVVGLVAVVGALLSALTAVEVAADPPDTVKLNTQRTETPWITILGASDAGVLYTVQHPDFGAHLPPGDPSGLETVTWLKPAGKPAVRVGREFEDLHGNYVFAVSTFRRIDTGETRTCASSPGVKRYFATGWLDSAGGNYRLTTIGPSGCSTRLLAVHPGTYLQAADENGFVVSAGDQLKYASYAAPATLKPIAMGNQHGQPATQVALSGNTVAWTIKTESRNWVFRGSTNGAAPTESDVAWSITSLAVTATHTGWASSDHTSTLPPANRFGTIPTGGTTSTERVGTGSVVSDGTQFVIDAVSTQAGPHRTPNAAAQPTLIQAVDKMTPLGGLLAIGAGRIAYTDSRGTGAPPVIRRGYRQGHPPVLGPESTVTAGAHMLSQDGRRTALLTPTGVWLFTEGGKTRWLAKPVAQPRMLGGVKVSGTRVMWAVFRPHDSVCDPVPLCPPPYPETVYLYDARTQRTSRIPGGQHTVYGLWGNYFLAGKADGSIYRRDLSGTRVERVKGPGERLNSLDPNGSWVGWATCQLEACGSWSVGYRNMLTSAAPVQLRTYNTQGMRLTGGHLLYTTAAKAGDPLVLKSLRLGSSQPTVIGPASSWFREFDAHDETVTWIGQDFGARMAPLSSYVARPRYLGNAIGAASFHPGRWTIEFPMSKALPVCGVTIRRGAAVVRSLGCATQTGSAIAAWDGRDSVGRRVPNGRYSWTFNGRDADGWLLWWNGSGSPITGTVTVN